jgi:hypothetical protein
MGLFFLASQKLPKELKRSDSMRQGRGRVAKVGTIVINGFYGRAIVNLKRVNLAMGG